jgi:hypothetical protein
LTMAPMLGYPRPRMAMHMAEISPPPA